jgi:hypothetical protein
LYLDGHVEFIRLGTKEPMTERTFGNDYYQDMMLWPLPAALEDRDVATPVKPGGLLYRVIAAARKQAKHASAL